MNGPLRIALAQVNPTVGDIPGNTDLVLRWIEKARNQDAGLIAFPELVLAGYPPEDLLFHESFLTAQKDAISRIASAVDDAVVFVGYARQTQGGITNAAAVLHRGAVAAVYEKIHLPNYGVFDEVRYFVPGTSLPLFDTGGAAVAVNICEDIWPDRTLLDAQCLRGGAALVVNLSSSPFHAGKNSQRLDLVKTRAREGKTFLAYVNLVGGQDEIVFDGRSFLAGPEGEILARAPAFEEALLVADVDLSIVPALRKGSGTSVPPPAGGDLTLRNIPLSVPFLSGTPVPLPPAAPPHTEGKEEEIYGALVLGTRDYVRKNGFTDITLGLSGGVDSALVAVIAADALGADRVHAVAMPSPYSSPESLADARSLSENLGTDFIELPIAAPFESYLHIFEKLFPDMKQDITEENIQARIRGNLLMALSNKHGWLVLTTGNKSEVCVGYSTLYGDTAGGFAVIKDVYKGTVYDLCRYRNRLDPVIPENTLTRAPTAELRPDQTDRDLLPPYPILDRMLKAYVEENRSVDEIGALVNDRSLARRVVGMVNRAEFKRRQSPPGVKITPRAFGRDRRMPITHRFKA